MRLSYEYIAGFLDCDGTVVVVRAKRDGNQGYRYYGKICFYSQNIQVLEDIKETIGGSVAKPVIDVFQLQVGPRDTVAALKVLVPHLRIKREQALVVLKLHEMIAATSHPRNRGIGKGGAARMSDSVYADRHALYLRVRELNHVDSEAFRKNRENSVKTPQGVIPSQAAEGEGSAEGVTTSSLSPNDNANQETPTRKGRDSLSSARTDLVQ